ncbi:MAG: ATP-binding protein, partial [Bacteroidota bacterium]
LTLLVDRVLKMSLFEREKMELRLEEIDVSQLLSSIVATMQLQFQKHQAEVNLEIGEGDFHLVADRLHLSSVIFNLIDNALKYSPRHPKISLNLRRKNGEINVSVADQGLGIPKSYQDKIFDKFFRVPTGDRHDVKGHGLGLSYVAEVMRRHQGRIELESQVGRGSTFTLNLPLSTS